MNRPRPMPFLILHAAVRMREKNRRRGVHPLRWLMASGTLSRALFEDLDICGAGKRVDRNGQPDAE